MLDADGVTRRLLVGRVVGDRRRVEDHEVGEGALAQHATVAQAQASRGHAAQLRDGRLERERPALADVRAEHARGAPVRPRVRPAGVEDRVTRPARLGVRADRDPGHGHDRLDVGLVHAIDDDRDVELIVDQRVHRQLGRVDVHLLAELRQRASRPVGMARRRTRSGSLPSPDPRPRSPIRRSRAPSRRRRGPGPRGRSARRRNPRHRARGDWAGGSWPGSSRRPCTGTGPRRHPGPSARAASRTAMASPARPHTARAPHLRCETWSRGPVGASVARRPDRRDRFVERVEQPGALVAHVRRVQATAPCGRRDQGHELVGGGMHPRRVDQPGRQPERAGVQRGLDLAHHRPALIVGGGAGLGAHHGPTDRPLPDEERDIQPERAPRPPHPGTPRTCASAPRAGWGAGPARRSPAPHR